MRYNSVSPHNHASIFGPLHMPLDVSSDVLAIVQRVCDKALNVAKARAMSSALGPKAGMRALYGKTVKHLPRGEGVVKDRVLKMAAEKKKRKSGRSGASNWPRGTMATRERFKAESARRAAERAAAAALREAMSELDDGVGPYMVRSPEEWLAITQVRQALASDHGLSPNELRPSAAVAVTLLPGSIDAYTNGYIVAMSEGTTTSSGLRAGDSLRVRKGRTMCDFATPGVERALVFHAAK